VSPFDFRLIAACEFIAAAIALLLTSSGVLTGIVATVLMAVAVILLPIVGSR
jgi:hypothetical protein